MTASRKPKSPAAAPVRCAIYTRKSTEEGLDQDFNSLDAQREAAEAYIRSQAHAGWTCLPTRYDDGGYTGSNLDRPARRTGPGVGGPGSDRSSGEGGLAGN
jgi:site-specific DNA recombinase